MGEWVTEDRRQQLRALLAADGNSASSPLGRLCALAVSELAVTGAGVTLLNRAGAADAQQRLVQASDARAAHLEDLQLTVGEGPGVQATTSGTPIQVPDLTAARARWPAFTPSAQAAGVAAVFAFPLQLGVIELGSFDCYRATVGELSGQQVADALVLAELATEAILVEITGHQADDLGWITDIHPEVHQASGMMMYQLGITIEAALLRMRGHAYAHDLPLAVVARRVVNRRLQLDTEQ